MFGVGTVYVFLSFLKFMENIFSPLFEGRRKYSDKNYIKENFENAIDLDLLGERLGDGAEHRVYEYGDGDVVKIPWVNMLYGHYAGEMYRNYDICQKHFAKYLPKSEIIHDGNGRYILIQTKLNNPRNFNVHDLEDEGLRSQFEEIIEANQQMVSEGFGTYDFFGMTGFLDSYIDNLKFDNKGAELSNIMVEEQDDEPPRLVLPEFDVIRYRDSTRGLKDSLICSISFLAQRYSMKKFFGYDIGRPVKYEANLQE